MPSLADYELLHADIKTLTAGTPNSDFEIPWEPPKRFVKGTGVARPLITLQLWTHTITEFSVYFEYNGVLTSGAVTRGNLPAGHLITHTSPVGGLAMAEGGTFKILAGFNGQVASSFDVTLVKLEYQRFR